MARKLRVFFDGIAQHVLIEGLIGKPIFRDHEDYQFYHQILQDILLDINKVDLHAYALGQHTISFLLSSADQESLSRFVQSLKLKYVAYYNKKYSRKGTLWQGRFKNSLIQDKYILGVMHYIESTAQDLQNSSYGYNALGYEDELICEHEMYLLLGKNKQDRIAIYSKSPGSASLQEENDFIKECVNKQLPTGDMVFYKELEELSGESLFIKKRGRPKKKSNKRKKMYSKLSVLNKEEHKSLKISPIENLNFAKKMQFIPIVANETAQVSEAFPVVFTADEKPALVTLTSLGDVNLAINQDGKYITRYVPAFLRKYPFSLAAKKDSAEKIVLIDEEATCVSKTKGKQLFTKKGEQTETLKNAIDFLTDYEKQLLSTQAVLQLIKEADILEDREISIGEGEEKKVLVNGFQVVDREKLNKLDDATLALWVRKGIISFIDAHIDSLSKIEVLFKLSSQNQQANS